jgi:hypothetical protein
MKRSPAFLLLLALSAVIFALDSGVGSIASIAGDVKIDAFGTGAFIPAIKGEILYPKSLIRTGASGRAEAAIGGKSTVIGPGTTVKIANLIAQGKKASTSWIGAFTEVYKNLKTAATGQSDLMLGTRAAEAEAEENEWVVEEDDADLLEKAQARIDGGGYRDGLALLEKISSDSVPELRQRRDYLAGLAYFSLEAYPEAEPLFDSVEVLATDSPLGFADEEMRARTLFGLGVSRYMTGRERESLDPLRDLLSRDIAPTIDPWARLFFVKSLYVSGDLKGAEDQLAMARRKYRGTNYEASFAPSPAEL